LAQHSLLVLDNFEQVRDAAGLVGTLLYASGGARVSVALRHPGCAA